MTDINMETEKQGYYTLKIYQDTKDQDNANTKDKWRVSVKHELLDRTYYFNFFDTKEEATERGNHYLNEAVSRESDIDYPKEVILMQVRLNDLLRKYELEVNDGLKLFSNKADKLLPELKALELLLGNLKLEVSRKDLY